MTVLSLIADGRFALEGNISKTSVPELVESGWDMLSQSKSGGALVVDLSRVSRADSAALAMLLEWMRRAQQRSIRLRFEHFPKDLVGLASVCGVDQILQ